MRVEFVAGLNPTPYSTSWRKPCTTCVRVLEGTPLLREFTTCQALGSLFCIELKSLAKKVPQFYFIFKEKTFIILSNQIFTQKKNSFLILPADVEYWSAVTIAMWHLQLTHDVSNMSSVIIIDWVDMIYS